ncbi:hypothetical protein EPK99_18100 [Neorhizobium lilium]|uniref:Uncharacterized protein n=1 Tax=Neorhizobium lilium TaxID=2503024 RepID=A0A3S3VFT2_9HYPH|nr:hypothetical protein EPK99_18100 [Neorhizobium lilium]
MASRIPHVRRGAIREKSGSLRPVAFRRDAVRLAEVQPEKEKKAWHCLILACASFWKLVFTSATRPIAGTRR